MQDIARVLEGLHSRVKSLETLHAKINKNKPHLTKSTNEDFRKLLSNSRELASLYNLFVGATSRRKLSQQEIYGEWMLNKCSEDAVFGVGHVKGDAIDFEVKIETSVDDIADILADVSTHGNASERAFKRSGMQKTYSLTFLTDSVNQKIKKREVNGSLRKIKQILNDVFPEQEEEPADDLVVNFSKVTSLHHNHDEEEDEYVPDKSGMYYSDDEGDY